MPYSATVFKILIASPSDVETERNLAIEVINKWNNSNSFFRKIILLPVLWEHNAAPQMGMSGQDVINEQIVDSADLVVGIFWTKIGTPTTSEVSGTVEEISRHMGKGKLTMLYFSSHAVPKYTDQGQLTDVIQLEKTYQGKGLTASYEAPAEFEKKFRRHLEIQLTTHSLFVGKQESENVDFLQSYLFEKLADCSKDLLVQASKDSRGQIMSGSTKNGRYIQTNGRSVFRNESPSEIAAWVSAIEELLRGNLIRKISDQVYEVTGEGYKLIDTLLEKESKE
jgi:hypothetical protein